MLRKEKFMSDKVQALRLKYRVALRRANRQWERAWAMPAGSLREHLAHKVALDYAEKAWAAKAALDHELERNS